MILIFYTYHTFKTYFWKFRLDIYILVTYFYIFIVLIRFQVIFLLQVASEIIYLIGVNLMGIYFRLMNEIVTRRSFLDRRACVESTLRLKFVKEQEVRLILLLRHYYRFFPF